LQVVRRRALPLLAVVALALGAALPGALAGSEGDPGVTPTSILLGSTVPLSGPAAAFGSIAYGAEGYFKYVNGHGGVNGRKIQFDFVDDAYDPAQTVQQTRRLVEQDHVFAIVNSAGTEHVEAVRPYLNQQGVPQLFVGSGATSLGTDYKTYPWTMGYLPSFSAEGFIYGSYISRTAPTAKIAAIVEDSDFGKNLLSGLKRGLATRARQLVAAQAYDVTAADVSSQIATLKASGADTLMIFATPKAAIQSYISAYKLGWKPHVYISSVAIAPAIMDIARFNSGQTTEGSISIVFIKDPTNVKVWGKDPGVVLYRSIMKRYEPGRNANDAYHEYGMAVAFTTVDALKKAGRNLTRRGFLNAAVHLDETTNPFLLPGIAIKTSPTDHFPLDQAQLYRYQGGVWRGFGPLLGARL
jgi:ABC-type branched-subunit amino acid transport system substrate-binding protein